MLPGNLPGSIYSAGAIASLATCQWHQVPVFEALLNPNLFFCHSMSLLPSWMHAHTLSCLSLSLSLSLSHSTLKHTLSHAHWLEHSAVSIALVANGCVRSSLKLDLMPRIISVVNEPAADVHRDQCQFPDIRSDFFRPKSDPVRNPNFLLLCFPLRQPFSAALELK